MDAPQKPDEWQHWLAGVRDELRRLELRAAQAQRKDGYRIPSGIYETLEDIGRIEGAMDSLRRIWHKDNPEYRKAMLHLSRIAWDLRKKLHEHL